MKTTQSSKTFQNVNRSGESGNREQDLPAARQSSHDYRQPPGSAAGGGSMPRWPDRKGNGAWQGRPAVKCYLCQEKHFLYYCPLLTLETDPSKVRAVVQEKERCVKCLLKKHPGDCRESNKPYVCPKHKENQIICKCSDSKWTKPKIQQNSTNLVNRAVLGSIGFDTEMVVIRNGNKQRRVLLTYDSFASHTTLNKTLKQELGLKENSIGKIEIQTYAGSVQEEGFVVKANIDGAHSQKIDFLISTNAQTLPVCKYDIPQCWIQKYNLPRYPKSEAGLNLITIGKDQCALFPVLLDACNGVAISKSNITGRCILSGRAKSNSNTMMANKTVVREETSKSSSLTWSETVKNKADPSKSETCTEISSQAEYEKTFENENAPKMMAPVMNQLVHARTVHIPQPTRPVATAPVTKNTLLPRQKKYENDPATIVAMLTTMLMLSMMKIMEKKMSNDSHMKAQYECKCKEINGFASAALESLKSEIRNRLKVACQWVTDLLMEIE